MDRLGSFLGAVATALVVMIASAGAQEVKHYRFAYDQPKITGYGILGDIFSEKLKALSKGTMLIDQYPGRAARAGAAGSAARQIRRRRVLYFVFGERRYAVAAGRRHVDAFPVPLGSPSHQGDGGSRRVRCRQGDDCGHGAGRPRHRARDARFAQHVFEARDQEDRTISRGSRCACRRHRPRTPCSRPMALRSFICRSAASTPRCRPAWSMSRKTASTSISPTSTTKWLRCCR